MVEEREGGGRSRSRSPVPSNEDENTWKCENCGKSQAMDREKCIKCRLVRGQEKTSIFKEDWECITCGSNNFSRRIDCFKCHAKKPPVDPKHPNDWTCLSCKGNNFSRRVDCYKCGEMKPRFISHDGLHDKYGAGGHPAKQDDWFCRCGGHNFSRRLDCYKCHAPKPRPPAPQRYPKPSYLERPTPPPGRPGGMSRMRSPTPDRGYRQRSPIRGGPLDCAPDVDPVTGEMKWTCPVCGVPNFYKRFDCYRCYERKPGSEPRDDYRWNTPPQGGPSTYDQYPPPPPPDRGQRYYPKTEPKKRFSTDWICSDRNCQGMNFSKRTDCYRCHLPRPDSSKNPEIAKNDWECIQCGGNNYSRRVTCYRCSDPKPEVDAFN